MREKHPFPEVSSNHLTPRPRPLLLLPIGLLALLSFGCESATDEAERLSGQASRLLREAQEQSGAAGETRWMAKGGWPVPRFIPGDEGSSPDVVGYLQRGDSADWVSIGAFNGRSFEKRWIVGPFEVAKRYGQPFEPILVVARGHVVASPDRQKVRVLAASDGHELGAFDLGSKVRAICAAPDGAGYVWIDLESTQHKRLNVADGTIEAMDRPPWCPQPGAPQPLIDPHRCARLAGDATCRQDLGEATLDLGLDHASYFLLHQKRGVAVGRGADTDRINTTVVGVDLGEHAVTWRQSFGEEQLILANLRPGRFYAVVQNAVRPTDSHLVAIDTSNGQALWRSELPWANSPVVGPLVIEGERLFLPREGWLDVFDTRGGQTLGAIGHTP